MQKKQALEDREVFRNRIVQWLIDRLEQMKVEELSTEGTDEMKKTTVKNEKYRWLSASPLLLFTSPIWTNFIWYV